MSEPLSYSLTFAGVPLVSDRAKVVRMPAQGQSRFTDEEQEPPRTQQVLVDLVEEIDRRIPFQYVRDLAPLSPYPGRNLGGLDSYHPSQAPSTGVHIGDFYYPAGASRFSVFRALATSSQVKAILAATNGTTPKTLSIQNVPVVPGSFDPLNYTIETSMYALPARPLSEGGGGAGKGTAYDGLFLLTLVDERYYWLSTPASFQVVYGTTWDDLIAYLSGLLGVAISYSEISSVYGQPEPDSPLWCNAENAAMLLDAVAENIGCTVVRELDGTYTLLTPDESLARVATNRGTASRVVRTAGGDMFSPLITLPAGNLNKAKNSIVPSSVSVTFPRYITSGNPVPHFDNPRPAGGWYEDSYGSVYEVEVPITSGGPLVSGLVGTGSYSIHTTAKAVFNAEDSANPSNLISLRSLSVQLARNYYGMQVGAGLDEVYPGVFNWTPEGFHDLIWTYSARKRLATTRVVKTEWNPPIQELQHSTPLLSGQSLPLEGSAGIPVAQTWRDSASGGVTALLADNLASGAAGTSAPFSSIGNLPTQNRWKGRVDGETILFEGTSGGLTVGIARRGIDGTLETAHSIGATVTQLLDTGYDVNLVTLEKNQFVYPSDYTSGGIRGVNLIPQSQTIQILDASGVSFLGMLHYSGRVMLPNLAGVSGSEYAIRENVWVRERNFTAVTSGAFYAGTFAGWAASGREGPLYLVNQGGGGGSGIEWVAGVSGLTGLINLAAPSGFLSVASGELGPFAHGSGNVHSGQIFDNAIASGQVASGVLGSVHLRSGTVQGQSGILVDHDATRILLGADIPGFTLTSGIIQSGHIGNAAVNSGNIASGAVGWPHHASGSVRSGHVADAAVNSGNVGSGQLSWPHLSSGSVRSGHVADAAVNSGNLGSGQVAWPHLSSGTVRSGHIANAAVASGNIASGNVGAAHTQSGILVGQSGIVIDHTLPSIIVGLDGAGFSGTIVPAVISGNDLAARISTNLASGTASGKYYVPAATPFSISGRIIPWQSGHYDTDRMFSGGPTPLASGQMYSGAGLWINTAGKYHVWADIQYTNAGSVSGAVVFESGATVLTQIIKHVSGEFGSVLGFQDTDWHDITRFTAGNSWTARHSIDCEEQFLSGDQIHVRVFNYSLSGAIGDFFGYFGARKVDGNGAFGSGSVVSGSLGLGVVNAVNIGSGAILGQSGILVEYNSGIRVGLNTPVGALASGSVQSGNVASGAVQGFFGSTRHIAPGTVGVSDFGSGAVVAGKVGSGAIRSGNIASGQIGRGHLGSGAVASGAIAFGAVLGVFTAGFSSESDILSGTIGAYDLAIAGIFSGHLSDTTANRPVISGVIASGQIGYAHLVSGLASLDVSLVDYQQMTNTVASVTFAVNDLGDRGYILAGNATNTARGAAHLYWLPNGATTNLSYCFVQVVSGSTSAGVTGVSIMPLTNVSSGDTASFTAFINGLTFGTGGPRRNYTNLATTYRVGQSGIATFGQVMWGTWNNTGNSLTSIVIESVISGGIGSGSWFALYKYRTSGGLP